MSFRKWIFWELIFLLVNIKCSGNDLVEKLISAYSSSHKSGVIQRLSDCVYSPFVQARCHILVGKFDNNQQSLIKELSEKGDKKVLEQIKDKKERKALCLLANLVTREKLSLKKKAIYQAGQKEEEVIKEIEGLREGLASAVEKNKVSPEAAEDIYAVVQEMQRGLNIIKVGNASGNVNTYSLSQKEAFINLLTLCDYCPPLKCTISFGDQSNLR